MISFVSLRILISLMDGKIHPAKKLAEENEVSTKTIRRAVDTLISAGIFVMSQKGQFGGYFLSNNHIPLLSRVPAKELGELMSICKIKDDILPKSLALSSVQDAIINSTAEKNLGEVIRQSSKIVVDTLPWHQKQISKQKFDKIYKACTEFFLVQIDYVSYGGQKSKRTIKPYCLTLKDGSWYTYAEDETQDMKLFKLSRMSKITLTKTNFAPRPDIEVWCKPWNNSNGFSAKKVRLKIANLKLDEVQEWLEATTVETTDEFTIVEANATDTLAFYQKLLEFSPFVTLLSPHEMIQNLLALCKKVENHYSFT